MVRTARVLLAVGMLAAGLVLPESPAAQTPVPDVGTAATGAVHSSIELTRSVIQTQRQAILTNALDLSRDESESFWPLFREYQAERAKISDRRVKIILDYAERYPKVAADEAKEMIDGYFEIMFDDLKLRRRYLSRFRKILPELKATRFYQVENKLDAAINMELAESIPLVW